MAKNFLNFGNKKSEEVTVQKITATQLAVDTDPFKRYALFESLYQSNNLYTEIQRSAYQAGEWIEELFSLATPCNRSVEFYANRLLMGARITSTNAPLKEAIEIFLRDSNFNGLKTSFSREVSKMGDLFVKIKNDESKIWMEKIEPFHVTDITTDARGIVTEIRIDIPQEQGRTYTEFWTLDGGGYVSVWSSHPYGIQADLEQLGTPSFYATLSQWGITWIPIVYIKFKGNDFKRAENCFVHSISKINESNRERSRLASLMFSYNAPLWTVYGSGTDKTGGYLGNPEISMIRTDDNQTFQYIRNIDDLRSNIPAIDWQAHLAAIKDMKEEMIMDLPETKLNSLSPSQISGRAVVQLLGESVNRAKNARENLIQGLKRLNLMAVTIGQNFGFFPRSIGNYQNIDDFQHEIDTDAVIPLDVSDKSLILQQAVSAGMPLVTAMRMAEFTQQEIDQMLLDKQAEDAALADSILSNPRFTQDVNSNTNQQ